MRRHLGGHGNVVSIRPGNDERVTLMDFREHLESMETILPAFDGEPGGEHTARYLLREALRNTPIVAAEIPADMKDRLGRLYQQLNDMDQKYKGKGVAQILEEEPELAAYLRKNGFGPQNM